MAGVALVNPKKQFLSSAGVPLVSGTVDVYLAGSSTRSNTWTDRAQTSLNTNPITLDSRGECVLWVDDSLSYKLVLKNAAGVEQYTIDNVQGSADATIMASFGVLSTDYANFNAAVTAIGATPTTLLMVSTLALTGDVTVPSTLSVKILQGGVIGLGSYTLTMKGQFQADRNLAQCFTYSTGLVAFGAGSIDAIFPEWFGATPTGPNDTEVDSSAAILKALECAAVGTIGFTYQVELGQGCYWLATGIDVPPGGVFYLTGQGDGLTSVRGMNGGSGFPDYLFNIESSAYGNRLRGIMFYSGSSSRPMLYGVYSVEMSHVHIEDCSFQYFSRAAIVSTENDNLFRNIEFAYCGVAIWLKRAANNNDITIDVCRFVGCTVAIASNGGLGIRVRNCQFQGGLTASDAPKTHIYASRSTSFIVDTCYFEHQGAGMSGMTFTVPETVTIYAYIILNDSPYMDDDGVVTVTLAKNASTPNTGKIVNNGFMNAAGYRGAGGSGYSAGAVNLVAYSGTGSGATGTASVTSGQVSSVAIVGGGTGYRVGDTISIQAGAGTGATGLVTATTGAGVISALAMGQVAGIYMGACADMDISNNLSPINGALLSVYRDMAYCEFGKPILFGNRITTGTQSLVFIVGPWTTTLDQRLSSIDDNLRLQRYADYMGTYNLATGVAPTPSTVPPTASTYLGQSSLYRGFPVKRITLDAAQQTSESWGGSFAIASSGANNSDLANRRIYFSIWRNLSAANLKLRLTLSADVSGTVMTTSNYSTSTSFTSSAGLGRDEVSIVLPSTTATVSWGIELIGAAAAAGQYADMFGPVITMVGIPLDRFDRDSFRAPLVGTTSWTPGLLADGAGTTLGTAITVYGAQFGDAVDVGHPGASNGVDIFGWVSAANEVLLRAQNETGGNATPSAGTYRVYVTPRT